MFHGDEKGDVLKETSTSWKNVVPGDIEEDSSNIPAKIHMDRIRVKHVDESARRKAAVGKTKGEARQWQKIERISCQREDLEFKNFQECVEKKWESHMESAMTCKSQRSSGKQT